MRIHATVTTFAPSDPRNRHDAPGEVEVFPLLMEVRRLRRGRAAGFDRCGVFLSLPARASLACELVLSLPPAFLNERLGVGDGSTQLVRLLRRLAVSEETR